MIPRYTQPQVKKVWDAKGVGANEVSPAFEIFNCPFLSAFGHASGATTITLLVSMDGTNFYQAAQVVLSAAGDFYFSDTCGAEFVALQSSAAVTVTGIISAK